MPNIKIAFDDIRQEAKNLHNKLKEENSDIKLTAAQLQTANKYNCNNWQTLRAKCKNNGGFLEIEEFNNDTPVININEKLVKTMDALLFSKKNNISTNIPQINSTVDLSSIDNISKEDTKKLLEFLESEPVKEFLKTSNQTAHIESNSKKEFYPFGLLKDEFNSHLTANEKETLISIGRDKEFAYKSDDTKINPKEVGKLLIERIMEASKPIQITQKLEDFGINTGSKVVGFHNIQALKEHLERGHTIKVYDLGHRYKGIISSINDYEELKKDSIDLIFEKHKDKKLEEYTHEDYLEFFEELQNEGFFEGPSKNGIELGKTMEGMSFPKKYIFSNIHTSNSNKKSDYRDLEYKYSKHKK